MESATLWPLVVYFALVLGLVSALLGLSYVLGGRHTPKAATDEPFESGIVTVGYARFRVTAQFYLMAVFFVIFDLEAVFLFAWAVAWRRSGWLGYGEAMVFVAILVAALAYLWRTGALEWGPARRRIPAGRPQGRGA
ncbi:MAG TPA: NADH-quinone oxidoreductase subunit A [Gammaproteobacteria bacterium]|nr:NADH-quinone oxidoreductase subunit A [Gammaproteobacteria bacterium]